MKRFVTFVAYCYLILHNLISDLFGLDVPGENGICTCGSKRFYEGPSGSAGLNLICVKCDAVWFGCQINSRTWFGWSKVSDNSHHIRDGVSITEHVRQSFIREFS